MKPSIHPSPFLPSGSALALGGGLWRSLGRKTMRTRPRCCTTTIQVRRKSSMGCKSCWNIGLLEHVGETLLQKPPFNQNPKPISGSKAKTKSINSCHGSLAGGPFTFAFACASSQSAFHFAHSASNARSKDTKNHKHCI